MANTVSRNVRYSMRSRGFPTRNAALYGRPMGRFAKTATSRLAMGLLKARL